MVVEPPPEINYEKLATIARVGDDFHRELITTIMRQKDYKDKLEYEMAGLRQENRMLEYENRFLIEQLQQYDN